jgi:hypothetical protein
MFEDKVPWIHPKSASIEINRDGTVRADLQEQAETMQ